MTISAEPAGLAETKQFTRATWAAGDFGEIARRGLWEVGKRIVQSVGIGKNERVLDVACGTGNAAIRAAQAGGQVVGLDLTPELFETGRRLAAEANVNVEWVEGDAEAIPYPDNSFDVVLSTFGSMFAPRHRVTERSWRGYFALAADSDCATGPRRGARVPSSGRWVRTCLRHPLSPSRRCCGAGRTTSASCSQEAEFSSSSSATRRSSPSHSLAVVRQSISAPATSVRA